MRRWLYLCLFLPLGLVVGCRKDEPSPVVGTETTEHPLRNLCGQTFGLPSAPVKIEAFLPVMTGCQDASGLWLVQTAQTRPEIFSVTIFDMSSGEGRRRMRDYGIRCAAVVINGSTRFDLPPPVGKILLEGPMDPTEVYSGAMHVARELSGDASLALPPPEDTGPPVSDERQKAGFQ